MKFKTSIINIFSLALFLLFASFSHAGTWVENFDDGDYNGWKLIHGSETHRAQVSVVNGELVFRYFNIPSGGTGDWLVLEASRNWSNYILELRLMLTEEVGPGEPGIIISYNDTFDGVPQGGPNTPFTYIQSYSTVLGMLGINGVWSFPASGQFTFSPGTWYQVKVLVQGSHYELFIDGQQVLTYDDDTFTSGGIGIGARDVLTHFDDIRIYGDSVPDSVTAIAPRNKLTTTWSNLKAR